MRLDCQGHVQIVRVISKSLFWAYPQFFSFTIPLIFSDQFKLSISHIKSHNSTEMQFRATKL